MGVAHLRHWFLGMNRGLGAWLGSKVLGKWFAVMAFGDLRVPFFLCLLPYVFMFDAHCATVLCSHRLLEVFYVRPLPPFTVHRADMPGAVDLRVHHPCITTGNDGNQERD